MLKLFKNTLRTSSLACLYSELFSQKSAAFSAAQLLMVIVTDEKPKASILIGCEHLSEVVIVRLPCYFLAISESNDERVWGKGNKRKNLLPEGMCLKQDWSASTPQTYAAGSSLVMTAILCITGV